MSRQKRSGSESLSTSQLELRYGQGAITAGYDDFVADAQNAARLALLVSHMSAPDLQGLLTQQSARSRCGSKSTYLALEIGGVFCPAKTGLFFLNLAGISRARFVLWFAFGECLIEPLQDFVDERGAYAGQFVMQGTGVLVRCDRHALSGEHRSGIEAGIHSHDGDPRFRISCQEGSLDGRSAAPARQERSVNVQGATQGIQDIGRDNQPVGGDDGRVRTRGANPRRGVGPSEIRGLPELQPLFQRKTLDRTRLETQAAAGGPIRLGQDERNLVPCRNEGREGPFREVGCAGEN